MLGLEKLNGTTKLILSVAAIITLLWTFDNHYAKASDVRGMQQDVSKVVTVLTMNYITRKTVLELKKANEGLTAAETVELKSIYEILTTLEK